MRLIYLSHSGRSTCYCVVLAPLQLQYVRKSESPIITHKEMHPGTVIIVHQCNVNTDASRCKWRFTAFSFKHFTQATVKWFSPVASGGRGPSEEHQINVEGHDDDDDD